MFSNAALKTIDLNFFGTRCMCEREHRAVNNWSPVGDLFITALVVYQFVARDELATSTEDRRRCLSHF